MKKTVRLKGTVTIFLALILVTVMGVVGALLESARFNVAKEIVLDTAYLSIQNILAEYQRELWNDYHVFFVDAAHFKGDDGIEKLAGDYLSSMIEKKEMSLINVGAVFNRVSFEEAMVEDECNYFVKQAVDYMRKSAPKGMIKAVIENIGAGEAFEKGQKTFQKMLKAKLSLDKKLLKLERKKEKIKETYAELNKEVKEIKDFVEKIDEMTQDGEIIEKIRKFEKIYTNKDKEIETLEKERILEKSEAKQEIDIYIKELDESKDELVKEDYRNLKKSIESGFFEDKVPERIEDNEKRLKEIIKISEKEPVDREKLRREINTLSLEKENEKIKEAERKLKKYEEVADEITNEGGKTSFILNIMGGKGIKVSKKKVKDTKWKKYGNHEEGKEVQWMDKGLFFLYMKKHFPYFSQKKDKSLLKRERKQEALDYGLEYIVTGGLSDEENLRGVVQKIFGFRTMAWVSYYLSRPDKLAEATEMATATVGVLGPGAVVAAKTAIILSWSVAEARKDVNTLLKGGKVSFYPGTASIKIDYEKYLDILLVSSLKHWAKRSLKLVEQNIRLRYNEKFQADNCFSGIVGEVSGQVEPRFFRLGFIRRRIQKELNLWQFDFQLSESLSR